MNDKQKLAAIGAQYRLTEEQAKGLAERMPQTGTLQVIDDEPLCMAKRIDELEARVRVMAELLQKARPYMDHRGGAGVKGYTQLAKEIDSALAGNLPERKITKPARVWGARFRPGIPEQTIIKAAYRYAEHESSQEEKEAGKINFDLLMAAVHKIAPEGWQLVPVEPTLEMSLAGVAAQAEKLKRYALGGSLHPIDHGMPDAYRAMLAAAPSPGSAK